MCMLKSQTETNHNNKRISKHTGFFFFFTVSGSLSLSSEELPPGETKSGTSSLKFVQIKCPDYSFFINIFIFIISTITFLLLEPKFNFIYLLLWLDTQVDLTYSRLVLFDVFPFSLTLSEPDLGVFPSKPLSFSFCLSFASLAFC